MFDLTGNTALITGASGGIGAAIARALHQQGATVVLHGTRAERLAALADELLASEGLDEMSFHDELGLGTALD